jgi:hypothetical protein
MQEIDRSYRRNLHSVVLDHIPEDVILQGNTDTSWDYGYNTDYDMVVISKDGTIGQIIEINTLKIALPAQPKKTIRFNGLTRDVQKWARYKVPYELDNFDKAFASEKNIESKINEIAILHKEFIDKDAEREEKGDWLYIDGEPTYISGGYYFFLQWYFLPEDGMFPQFRMPQRDYFIWLEACYADRRCVGSLLLKSRRSAFTVTSSSEILRDSIRYYNAYYPIMADVEKHANKIFSNYIVKPFLSFPKHLQPMRTGNVVPKSELAFDAPKRKFSTNSKISVEADGLGTIIAPTATTLNAYDSTRPRKSFNDEIGKTEIDITEWWAVHKKCHLEGRSLKGKAICGSTANPPQRGGKPYQLLYENSKLTTRGNSGFTKSGLYALFIPGDFAQTGYFDQWGFVVYKNTSEPILRDSGEMLTQGSKEFLDDKEIENADNPKAFNYEKRQDPRVDTDPFRDEHATNMYATDGMVNLINFLKEYQKTPKYKTSVFRFDLVWKNGIPDSDEVEMVRTDKGKFMAYAPDGIFPIPLEMRNKFTKGAKGKSPVNGHLAGLGIDPFTANRTQYGGSKQGIVGMTTDHIDLTEKQKDTVFLYYNFRGSTFEEGLDDAIKACIYLSIPALIETNKDQVVREFYRRGMRHYVANNPFKNKKDLTPDELSYGGIYTSASAREKQESSLLTYVKTEFPEVIDENNIKCPFVELNEHTSEYTDKNRTSKDDVVALQLARATTSKGIKKKEQITIQTASTEDLAKLFEFNAEPEYSNYN